MLERVDELAAEFRREGVLVLAGALARDPLFLDYVAELRALLLALYAQAGRQPDERASLVGLITELARTHRPLVGRIYDIGTGPAKLLSALRLKLHPAFTTLAQAVFGPGAVVASPTLSDTLHVFPPGAENFRFNLPIHQDYPYLMQSPAQITLWLSLGADADCGGVTVWRRSHTLGLLPCRRNPHGHLEVIDGERLAAASPSIFVGGGLGDVAVIDTFSLHRSEHNLSTDRTRLVQLFRYANLNQPASAATGWASVPPRDEVRLFGRTHPDKLVGEPLAPSAS
jgi:Phytanoyl-CoA dioxygenase (PhyH)